MSGDTAEPTHGDVERFEEHLREIDELLDRYEPAQLEPDRTIREVLLERATQRPLLERIVDIATRRLEAFPANGELLRRRAFARCRIMTETGESPFLAEAEADLRAILAFEPENLRGALDLLGELYTFSGLNDDEVAEIAEELARRAQEAMIAARALQIRALADGGREEEAREVAAVWTRLFPDEDELVAATP